MTGQSEARREVEQRNREMCAAYAAKDASRLAEYFVEDCWQFPPHVPPIDGRRALLAFWTQAFAGGDWRFELRVEDVALGGDLVVERGSYRVDFKAGPQAPGGVESNTDEGNYLVIWRRGQDGELRILWDAPSTSVPI